MNDKLETEDSKAVPNGFKAFSGIWAVDEAKEIEQIIAESCQTINPDDWK